MLMTVMAAILITSMGGCAGCNGNDASAITAPTAVITATTAPTDSMEPTKEIELTAAPSITDVPEATPTETPVVPTPMPTPSPIPTPEPTNTPIPTMAVSEDAKLLDSVKMGDNVWYDFYDDGTLVVRGTGATRDVKNDIFNFPGKVITVWYLDEEYDRSVMTTDHRFMVKDIFIEEGISGLGNWSLCGFIFAETVSFPSSLKTIGYAALFDTIRETTECVGLRSDMEIGQYALTNGMYPVNNVPTEFKEYTVAPTPLPLPTATPVPDPNKPRKYAAKKMGDDVTFEFWDNGYLYVKGTGATWDMEWSFNDFWAEPYVNTHSVIIEEGITYLGEEVFNGLDFITYFSLPKSLTTIGDPTAGGGKGVTFDGYLDGKSITVKTENATHSSASLATYFKVLEDIDAAMADGYEVIFH